MSTKPRVLFLVPLTFLCLFCLASWAQLPAEGKTHESDGGSVGAAKARNAATPATEDSKYAGSDTCKTCHEDLYNKWANSPHWKTTLDR